jgi:replicative DNA helicase
MRNKLIAQADPFAIGKVPPQAIDLEAAILGAVLVCGRFTEVAAILTADDFYKNDHRLIFEAIEQLDKSGRPIDLLTVVSQLRSVGKLDEVGGSFAVSKLTDSVASDANIEAHSMIVLEKSLARAQITFAGEIYSAAFDDTSDPLDTQERIANGVEKLSGKMSLSRHRSAYDIADAVLHMAEKASVAPSGITGVPTGFKDIDKLYGGRQPGDLIIKAGRPAMGKTAQAMCEAINMATRHDRRVAFFSLEMSGERLMQRILSVTSGVEMWRIQKGDLSEADWDSLHRAHKVIGTPNLAIFEDTFNLQGIRATCRKLRQSSGLDIVYIDYLQLIQTAREHGQNREQEISTISRTLKLMAKSLGVPVVALSQLSRQVEQRGGSKRPQLSDLRESGAIEQDADIVEFLYRPEYYGFDQSESGLPTHGLAELIVAKNRNGSLGDIPLRFIHELTKFQDFDEAHTPKPLPELPPLPSGYRSMQPNENF